MKYTVTIGGKKCLGCGRGDVKHHAKGLCNNCYHKKLKGLPLGKWPVDKKSRAAKSQ